MKYLLTALLFPCVLNAATEPDWSEGTLVPEGGRANLYGLAPEEWQESVQNGRLHALIYPVEVTGMQAPYYPIRKLIGETTSNPKSGFPNFKSLDTLYAWLGLHPYPDETSPEVAAGEIPYPDGVKPKYRMGVTLLETSEGTAFTFSCAACHTANLFGRKIIGMSNRFPKANKLFLYGKRALLATDPLVFQSMTGATQGERRMFERSRENAMSIEAREPQTLGLDTSLAHVALSLSHRLQNDFATTDRMRALFPREEPLRDVPADSKPAVWWLAKYKNRWLSDGSVVSGNPIFTNFIWNEIGRGVDLHELESWLTQNEQKVRELTSAVFATEAPRITDYFDASRIDLAEARRGETIFIDNCARCHGRYDKAWSESGSDSLPLIEKLRTTRVSYPAKTRVVNVGTDPLRYQGMKSLEQLNNLSISKRNAIVVRAQKGYVPQPLVGIWARWPYFHNNSAPSLCAVLTKASDRPREYWAGAAIDREKDFDFACNGYPARDLVPPAWRETPEYRYDTTKPGLSNQGHDEGIFLEGGEETLTDDNKKALIAFLQTL